jgi:MOSC domain-containing protein YiiM
MQGTVRALFVAPKKKAEMLPLTQVEAAQTGFAGDFHSAGPSSRQILMISNSVLEEFELSPGALSENMVIEGLDVMRLSNGQRLQVGHAVLEVLGPCDPCSQMERIRSGLKQTLFGKRGRFAKVVTAGVIRVGDPITL